jgi:L-arabinose isomerase
MRTSFGTFGIPGLLILFAAALPHAALAGDAEDRQRVSDRLTKEYQVKAAFLYNFTKFVEWRGSNLWKADETVVICVAAPSAKLRVISETLREKKDVSVRPLTTGSDGKGCAVVFQSSGDRAIRDNWLDLAKAGSLVVTEDAAQLQRGSLLNFYLSEGKVRFEANLAAAKVSGFRLHAQLLQLARIAKPEGDREP